MAVRSLFAAIMASSCVLAGCRATLHNLRIPLADGPATKVAKADARVVIEDARPDKERRPHFGTEFRSCERWFGDDTLEPSKLSFLALQVSERTRSDMRIHILLKRFDVIEYCEMVPVGSGTGAAQSGFTAAPTMGDTVVMGLVGDVNGMPFDLESRFDYGTMYRFPNLPSSSPGYREQLRGRLDALAKEIANLVWGAEITRIERARK